MDLRGPPAKVASGIRGLETRQGRDGLRTDLSNHFRPSASLRSSKGRKLVEADVISIRKSAEHDAVLADRFDVSRKTVEQVRKGETWKNTVLRPAVGRKRRCISICEQCSKPFKHGLTGCPRQFCDACRKLRLRTLQAKLRLNALELRLRPIIEKVVRELLDAGILKPGAGQGGVDRPVKASRRADDAGGIEQPSSSLYGPLRRWS